MNERSVQLPSIIRDEQQAGRKLAFLQKGKDITLEQLEKKSDSWWKHRACEPKIDGIRAVYYDGQLISFTQKKIYNCEPIIEELQRIILPSEILDGELYGGSGVLYGGSWERTVSVVMSSKTIKPLMSIKFNVFDCIPRVEFERGYGNRAQYARYMVLDAALKRKEIKYVQHVPRYKCSSFKQFKRRYDQYLACGYEGAMLKHLGEPYMFYKGDAWLKCKHTETADVTIVELKRGTGKYKDMLGSFSCIDEHGKLISVSGMSDAIRHTVWSGELDARGRVIEVKFFKRTQQGNMYSAHFLRWRDDK